MSCRALFGVIRTTRDPAFFRRLRLHIYIRRPPYTPFILFVHSTIPLLRTHCVLPLLRFLIGQSGTDLISPPPSLPHLASLDKLYSNARQFFLSCAVYPTLLLIHFFLSPFYPIPRPSPPILQTVSPPIPPSYRSVDICMFCDRHTCQISNSPLPIDVSPGLPLHYSRS